MSFQGQCSSPLCQKKFEPKRRRCAPEQDGLNVELLRDAAHTEPRRGEPRPLVVP